MTSLSCPPRSRRARKSPLVCLAYHASLPRPDVVYAVFGDRKLFTAYYLSLRWDAPLVVTAHAYEHHSNPNPAPFATALTHCRRVLTVTKYDRRLLVEKWKVDPDKVEVVRLSVDTKLVSSAQRIVILIVGSVSHKKGHATLFEAVGSLGGSDVDIWVVGDAAGAHAQDPCTLARLRSREPVRVPGLAVRGGRRGAHEAGRHAARAVAEGSQR